MYTRGMLCVLYMYLSTKRALLFSTQIISREGEREAWREGGWVEEGLGRGRRGEWGEEGLERRRPGLGGGRPGWREVLGEEGLGGGRPGEREAWGRG